MTPNFTHPEWREGEGEGEGGGRKGERCKRGRGWRRKKEGRKELQETQVAAAAMCGRDISEEIPMQNHLLDKGIAKAYQENQAKPTIVN